MKKATVYRVYKSLGAGSVRCEDSGDTWEPLPGENQVGRSLTEWLGVRRRVVLLRDGQPVRRLDVGDGGGRRPVRGVDVESALATMRRQADELRALRAQLEAVQADMRGLQERVMELEESEEVEPEPDELGELAGQLRGLGAQWLMGQMVGKKT